MLCALIIALSAFTNPVQAQTQTAPPPVPADEFARVLEALRANSTANANAQPAPAQPNLPQQFRVPIAGNQLADDSVIESNGDLVTLVLRDGPLGAVLNAIASEMGLNVVSSSDVTGQVSVSLHDVPLADALDAILGVNGYSWVRQRNIILVSSLSSTSPLEPRIQGRQVRVFKLSYVSAADIDLTVKGLLSPVGHSFISEVDSLDKLKTREEIVVEDLPDYLRRIEQYVYQADRPPAQVLIEAHILQVELRDDTRHGINFEQIARISGANVSFQAAGFANEGAAPAFFVDVDGTDLTALLEALKATTNAKTLASPKVLAVNGQEARIQIGEQLGYFVTTTTQTSTLQDVNFIDLGVVLRVTPVISQDGQILMTVKPEVSTGRINPITGLPEEETTEVETTVLLPDGHAMLIGGLIKQETSDQQSKIPGAGDLPLIGRLFQRRQRIKDRSEIIITLIPRLVPYGHEQQVRHLTEVQRASTPLLHGALKDVDRRYFEPELPDACKPIRDKHRGPAPNTFTSPPVAYSPFSQHYEHIPEIPAACPPAPDLIITGPDAAQERSPSARSSGTATSTVEVPEWPASGKMLPPASVPVSAPVSRTSHRQPSAAPRPVEATAPVETTIRQTSATRTIVVPPKSTRSAGWRRTRNR
jgi:type II secretory pathway component GspD/PulD (secretin)